ncbi:MAG: PAS domain-containing protein [Chloroflexi bacterium]|jgi:adenylate cyclase|nr:PAS domain-containing protein [Chloroflexota bacterium]
MTSFRKLRNQIMQTLPLGFAGVSLLVLLLSPFMAFRWMQQPFLGLFLEPHGVVSQLARENWAAKKNGVQNYDQLITVNDKSITNNTDLRAALANAGATVSLGLTNQQGQPYQVRVEPRPFTRAELVVWFGIPYIVGMAFWFIGIWAYRLSSDKRSSLAFLAFTSSASTITAAYFDMNTTQALVLLWALSLPVAGGALLHLAMDFPKKMSFVERYPGLQWLPWLLTVALAIPVGREILAPSHPWGYINTWLWSYAAISLGILVFLGALVYRVARSHSAMIRQQSRIIVFGSALAFGPIMVTFLLPSAFGQLVRFQVNIAFPALIAFPLSVAYALVRYRLLDVDRIMGATLTYVLTATGAVGVFYLLITLISFLVPAEITPNDPVLVALYLLVLVVGLNPLRRLMQRAIDRLFYRTRADYRRVLSHLSRHLSVSPEMAHTLTMLEQELHAALAPEKVQIYLYDDNDAVYRPQSPDEVRAAALPVEHPLVEILNQGQGGIWFPPGRSLPEALSNETATLENIGGRVFTPLHYEGQMIGFLALGARRSGEPYTSDDLEFLEAVAGQSSLALENVRLFANLQDTLNQTLEMKNLMDNIFASMSSGVITTDLKRKITLFNQAAVKILGIPVEQAVGRTLGEALPDLGPHFLLMAASTLSDDSAIVGEEFNPVMLDRGPLFLRLSSTPLRDAQQNTKGATIVIDDLTKQRTLEAEQERIRQTFGRVVAPRVRDRLLADPSNLRLDGIRQPLTVLFADIHNFTPFSERTRPEMLFGVLNAYLSVAAQAVLTEEGTLDKFMGDAVMAFWNAPDPQQDHVLRAARAALAMDEAIRKLRAEITQSHQLYFSIGINTGEAMVGNVGTSDLFNYTVIGDTVNYTQRLESIAEPGQILLSEMAYWTIARQVIADQLPPIKVKGKAEPAVVYALRGLK